MVVEVDVLVDVLVDVELVDVELVDVLDVDVLDVDVVPLVVDSGCIVWGFSQEGTLLPALSLGAGAVPS